MTRSTHSRNTKARRMFYNLMNILLLLADSADTAAGTFLGLGIFGLLLVLVASLFWLWMLVDALTNTALDGTMKIVWALVIFFLHFLGALIYFFVGRRPRAGISGA
jgi:uncharacterized RDD family membrane protein YckC